MSIETLREIVATLAESSGALTALGAELQARATGRALHPSLRPDVDAVLEKIGATAALRGLTPDEIRPLATEIRHFALIDAELLAAPDREPGWTYTEHDVLATAGELTEGFANVMPRIAPELEGLSGKLEGDGRFLDVGTGVARLAIAFARRFPALRVVGIDTWDPSLALARANVAAAALQDRIELRRQSAEDLPDEAAFDLAWIPAPFIPEEVLPRVLARVHRAMKPGGWLLLATAKPGDDLRAALMRLRVARWGGKPTTQEDADRLLAAAGFAERRVLPGPPRDFKMIVAARR